MSALPKAVSFHAKFAKKTPRPQRIIILGVLCVFHLRVLCVKPFGNKFNYIAVARDGDAILEIVAL